MLLFDEREAAYTGGRSVNTISGVGDCAGSSCWRCTVAAAFDVEEIRRGRYRWNDEGREFVWGLKMVDEVENQAYGWSFSPPFLSKRKVRRGGG